MLKRLFDILFSLLVLILFSPIALVISIILLAIDEHEVFYFQHRVGKNEEEIKLIKFVTMKKNSPNIGAGDITLKNDPRVLPFGRILRKTKLNEFPQFINVLLGQMSIVGPRPLVKNQFNMIPDIYKKSVKKLKPGLTSIGSIIFRDEEKYLNDSNEDSNEFYKNEIVPFKASIESWYYFNHSFRLDILIIILTVFTIIFPNLNLYKKCFKGLPKHAIFNC